MDHIRAAFESWKANPSKATLIRLLEASQHLAFGADAIEELAERLEPK